MRLPVPDHPLPPGPQRAWGTGSIDQRGNGYTARWRDAEGRQRAQTFATIAEAEAHLAVAVPYARTALAELRGLADRWRKRAAMTGSWRMADLLDGCADELEKVISGG